MHGTPRSRAPRLAAQATFPPGGRPAQSEAAVQESKLALLSSREARRQSALRILVFIYFVLALLCAGISYGNLKPKSLAGLVLSKVAGNRVVIISAAAAFVLAMSPAYGMWVAMDLKHTRFLKAFISRLTSAAAKPSDGTIPQTQKRRVSL